MAFRSSAIASDPSSGNLTATPAGVQSGDYLSAVWIADGAGHAPDWAAQGWTELINNDQTGPDGQTMRYGYRIATGTDSFTFTDGAGGAHMLITAAHSGRNTSAPHTASLGQQNTSSNASGWTLTNTGVTAASGDDIVVYMQADITASGTGSFSTITSYTEIQDSTLAWVAGALDYRDAVSAGATGNLSSTVTATQNSGGGIIVVAIAAGGGGSAPMFRGS